MPYLFNGKELDTETRLYYYGARYYDPRVSLWLNVDPMMLRDEAMDDEDSSNGGVFNPMNNAVYAFSYQNPVKYVDPDGECPNCITAVGGALVGGFIGGGVEAGMQLYKDGKITSWKAIGGSAAQGAITGGVAGFTGGASLAVTAGVAGGANVVGGVANRAIQGKKTTATDVVVDATVGAITGSIGYGINKIVPATQSNTQIKNKLTTYLLNKNHDVGKSKADWFHKALGFTLDNTDDLAKQIKFDIKKATFQRNNGHGNLYQTVNTIKGANGKKIDVRFNWIIKNGKKQAELVGALPTKSK